ncbi:MAG: hypothetical protein KKC19_01530 [Nanoarchaeota archaeon]|nr:hypothetical protein [Nanoarchaeota archaeon]
MVFEKRLMKRMGKNGVVSEYLPWLLIAIAVLVILMITIFILKDKGVSLIEQIKGVFR